MTRKPHQFLLVCEDDEFHVAKVECPYGPGEELVDCAAIEECSCLNPDTDPKYEDCASFTYKVDEPLPIGHRDRWVRVWDPDTTPATMQVALDYEKAMELYEDKHEHGWGWEATGQCWVATGDHDFESLLELPNLQPGWVSGWVDNDGAYDDSWLVVTPV